MSIFAWSSLWLGRPGGELIAPASCVCSASYNRGVYTTMAGPRVSCHCLLLPNGLPAGLSPFFFLSYFWPPPVYLVTAVLLEDSRRVKWPASNVNYSFIRRRWRSGNNAGYDQVCNCSPRLSSAVGIRFFSGARGTGEHVVCCSRAPGPSDYDCVCTKGQFASSFFFLLYFKSVKGDLVLVQALPYKLLCFFFLFFFSSLFSPPKRKRVVEMWNAVR